MDRDASGAIEGGIELFGSVTPKRDGTPALHGFDALSDLDDNRDGKIDRRDDVFSELRLWVDRNHNGVSERRELLRLPAAGIRAIGTQFVETQKRDQFGNWYRYQGQMTMHDNTIRRIFDVYLVSAPTPTTH